MLSNMETNVWGHILKHVDFSSQIKIIDAILIPANMFIRYIYLKCCRICDMNEIYLCLYYFRKTVSVTYMCKKIMLIMVERIKNALEPRSFSAGVRCVRHLNHHFIYCRLVSIVQNIKIITRIWLDNSRLFYMSDPKFPSRRDNVALHLSANNNLVASLHLLYMCAHQRQEYQFKIAICHSGSRAPYTRLTNGRQLGRVYSSLLTLSYQVKHTYLDITAGVSSLVGVILQDVQAQIGCVCNWSGFVNNVSGYPITRYINKTKLSLIQCEHMYSNNLK